MNLCHRVFCSSGRYFKSVEDGLLPWALAEVDIGDNVLEIGPGYGANIRVLIDKAGCQALTLAAARVQPARSLLEKCLDGCTFAASYLPAARAQRLADPGYHHGRPIAQQVSAHSDQYPSPAL
jgi:hypothetical protein